MPDIFDQTKKSTVPQSQPIETKSMHPFTAFCINPANVSFRNQAQDEKILLFLRQHFITNVPWIILTALLLIFPIFAGVLFSSQLTSLSSLSHFLPLVLILFYYLLVFTYAFIQFITWFYNISLVTQDRIVDIDYSDLVYHDVAMTKLSLVEDVRYAQGGFIRTLFNYGDVFVQTAGENENFDFLAVPQPQKVVEIIENLIGRPRHAD